MSIFTLPKEGGLLEDKIPKGLLHSFEKIPTKIYTEETEACEKIANKIVEAINSHSGIFKLGLGTEPDIVPLFTELTKCYEEGKVSFENVQIFSVDEYLTPTKLLPNQLRNYSLYEEFLNKVNVKPKNVIIPVPEKISKEGFSEFIEDFDKKARNLDLLIMGIGRQGQVGFNEMGTSEKSRTRTVLLSYSTRKALAKKFYRDPKQTPRTAITMGITTILSAKQIILLAWGEDKAYAVKGAAEDAPTTNCAVSLLQGHENIQIFTDENAASLMTRIVAPWLVGPCEWTPKLIRKAVVWLCEEVKKPILKLVQQDYLNNSLEELLELHGPYDKINIKIFNDLQHTISGWPGGKPNADDTTRPVKSKPFPKTSLIFSPHPDDDVISMGGTFIRLVEQGHNVHVAYQTSGNVAVHDDVVMQHMDTAREIGLGDRYEEVKKLIASKKPGEPEPRELLNIKGSIRRAEAKAAVRSFGLNDRTNCHFLNLPFYESGGVKKNERTQVDIDIVKNLLQELKPHQIYLAGDLADPHGTHRVCAEVALEAIEQLKGEAWLEECHVWLYRGAWMEWELGRVDMAVPLSPGEVIKKRHAIYRHQSQKDIVPFPGEDSREFWQRAEERTQNTARLYDNLGMAEYQAIEVFVKLF